MGEAEIGTPTAGIAPLGEFMHTAIGSRKRIYQAAHMEVSLGHSNDMVPVVSEAHDRANRTFALAYPTD